MPSAGEVAEAEVVASFTDIPQCLDTTPKEIVNALAEIRPLLEDTRGEWEKRVAALKRLKGLCASSLERGGEAEAVFVGELRSLERALQVVAKDPRSQWQRPTRLSIEVCREAAYCTAFLCERLGQRFDCVAEAVAAALITNTANSAKVMASACELALRWIIRCVPSRRLLRVLHESARSKSKEVRATVLECVGRLLATWPSAIVSRELSDVVGDIRAGVGDADPAARQAARDAFKALEEVFPAEAGALLGSLDLKQQRNLQGGGLSNAPSGNSLASASHRPPTALSRLGPMERRVEMEKAAVEPWGLKMEMLNRGAPCVVEVESGSAAEKSGLRRGDEILAVNGLRVHRNADGTRTPHHKVTEVFERCGERVMLVLGRRRREESVERMRAADAARLAKDSQRRRRKASPKATSTSSRLPDADADEAQAQAQEDAALPPPPPPSLLRLRQLYKDAKTGELHLRQALDLHLQSSRRVEEALREAEKAYVQGSARPHPAQPPQPRPPPRGPVGGKKVEAADAAPKVRATADPPQALPKLAKDPDAPAAPHDKKDKKKKKNAKGEAPTTRHSARIAAKNP